MSRSSSSTADTKYALVEDGFWNATLRPQMSSSESMPLSRRVKKMVW